MNTKAKFFNHIYRQVAYLIYMADMNQQESMKPISI